MKVTSTRLAIGVILIITTLGLLRYQPWNSKGAAGTRDVIHEGSNTKASRELTVGFLPVTCHLTCPVTDYASKTTETNTNFNSRVFSDYPTVVSALEAKQVQATFMIVPLAMKLREQGVPVKICYLGHRDGSQIVVGKYSKIRSMQDLKGKTVAVPSLFSNQNFVFHKLMGDHDMKDEDITFVVLPPPDMPTSLAWWQMASILFSTFLNSPRSSVVSVSLLLIFSNSAMRASPVIFVLMTGTDFRVAAKSMARRFSFIVRLKSSSDSLASAP